MASDSDRWLFLLTVAALPLACADDVPTDPEGSTSTPPDPSTSTSSIPGSSEGSTASPTTTGLDGTSSSGLDPSTTAGSEDGSTSTGSSSGTTMGLDPGSSSSGENSSSSGEPLGLCEQWATSWVACYGYYTVPYLTSYCYDDLNLYVAPECLVNAQHLYACEAYGGGPCVANCNFEDDELQACEDQVQADQLGCAMLPMVPAVGTSEAQCGALAATATACDSAGYYIPGFSQYVSSPLEYMVDFCVQGAYFAFLFPPPAVGDACGGAYEELLTCISALGCSDLELATIAPQIFCPTQADAVTCRCELGA